VADDFATALARLLQDGALRDRFALDPRGVSSEMGLSEEDSYALSALPPGDLEYQAEILLGKRLETLRPFLSRTLTALGEDAFPVFRLYARKNRPAGLFCQQRYDALAFVEFLTAQRPWAVSLADLRRLRFLQGYRHLALHFLDDEEIRGRRRHGLRIFFRNLTGKVFEWQIYLGL